MFGKSRTLALAVATAGLIGMSATMASAASAAGPGGGGDFGVVNLSHNQIPVQLCNDTVPVNVIGGQVPIQNLLIALGLGNPAGSTNAQSNSSCHQNTGQLDNNSRSGHWCKDCDHQMDAVRSDGPSTVIRQDGPGDGGSGGDFGVVNLSHNQIPIQVCNDTIPVNVIGIQVPLQNVAASLGLLSPAGNTNASQDTSCHSNTGQADNNG